ncbi:YtxH domain-containing protein [Lacticaseibacillus mingshuiensis]|uniref:YtxH domain-containing protein n=1 Tax=Lacticaseibacillus mingshuiensis TaxID=2799574 RepID=A0ABW4CG82_9LACO|nr:YtxH domain-containing protein [Lacticaseibacillus mingshuiensis]
MANKGHFFLGFVFGAASALAATYLLTPQTSDELKAKFAEKKEALADRAADYYDYAKDATTEWRDSATSFVGDMKEKAKKKQTEGLADYDGATQALKDELTDTPDAPASDDFDDIVLDGKSAFAQAKDDFTAEADAAEATDESADPTEPAEDDTPAADRSETQD